MKKSLLILALMSFIGLAQAVELGVVAGGVSGANAGGLAGVTVGEKFGEIGITAGFARGWQENSTADRWSLVAGYDIAKLAGVTITPKVGYVYLDNSNTSSTAQSFTPSTSAYLVGLGASLPITKEMAVTADYAYQASANVNNIGNVLTAGLKYSF